MAIFLSAYAQSEKTKLSSKWGLALGAVIVFMIANIVIGVFLAKKVINKNTKKEELTSFDVISTAANAIGIALALLAAWLLSSKLSLLADGVFKGLGLTMMTLIGAGLIFAQLIIDHIIYTHCHPNEESLSRSSPRQ